MRVASDLKRWLWILGTIGAIAPFVGLFGTVVGIMNAFWEIGLRQSAGLAVVAPGIAEALINTAAGLGAAIPAVLGYNYLVTRIKTIAAEMDDFSLEFVSITERSLDDAGPYTAKAITERRMSDEGQEGMNAFLRKEKPRWVADAKKSPAR